MEDPCRPRSPSRSTACSNRRSTPATSRRSWRFIEPDAALVPQPGAIAEGSAAIRESLRWFLDRGGRISLETKLVLRVGDLAYLANRWALTGATMPDGSPAELGATTAEVARLQPDGSWLHVIDTTGGDLAA